MKSKTSFFNCGLIKSNLKRFWPLFTGYFLLLLLVMPMSIVNDGLDNVRGIIYSVCSYLNSASLAVTSIMAIATAMAVYGFMFNQRSCGLVASLPLKRKTIFSSAVFSGIVPVIAINLIIGLISAIPLIASPDKLAAEALLIWFAVTSMHYILFFGIASIISVITGNIVALPVFYVIFNFLAVFVEGAVRGIFSEFIFGLTDSINNLGFTFLSPFVYLNQHNGILIKTRPSYTTDIITDVSFSAWGEVCTFAAVGLVLVVVSLLMFRKRKMEACGDIVAVPALRPIFKYGVAVCSALASAILLEGIFGTSDVIAVDAWLCGFYLIIGAFVGYFGSEMMLAKSFHVFKERWTGFLVLALVCVVFIWGCITDAFGIAGRAPDAESVDYVVINADYVDVLRLEKTSSVSDVIALNNSIIENKAAHMNTDYYNQYYLSITYYLKNGKVITRAYNIDSKSADYSSYRQLLSCDEALDYYTTPSVPVSPEYIDSCYLFYCNPSADTYEAVYISDEQAADFFINAYTADVKCGNLTFQDMYDPEVYVEIYFIGPDGNPDSPDHTGFYCRIDPQCENSMSWVMDNLGIDLTDCFR